MEMGTGHPALSRNLLWPLSRTVDFEREVADANPQVYLYNLRSDPLIFYIIGVLQRLTGFMYNNLQSLYRKYTFSELNGSVRRTKFCSQEN